MARRDEGSPCMQGLGTLGARWWRSRTKQRPLSWECAGRGAQQVPHVASTAWKQEAGKVANRGPPGAGVPRGGEWRSTPVARRNAVSFGSSTGCGLGLTFPSCL